jgi:hypothetical protein
LQAECVVKITQILTDNGAQFTYKVLPEKIDPRPNNPAKMQRRFSANKNPKNVFLGFYIRLYWINFLHQCFGINAFYLSIKRPFCRIWSHGTTKHLQSHQRLAQPKTTTIAATQPFRQKPRQLLSALGLLRYWSQE